MNHLPDAVGVELHAGTFAPGPHVRVFEIEGVKGCALHPQPVIGLIDRHLIDGKEPWGRWLPIVFTMLPSGALRI